MASLPPENPPGPVRLQKVLAERGVASRREADALIAAGEVKVNGVIAVPGQKIDPSRDRIVVRRKGLPLAAAPEALTLVMNKPRGVLCSHHDPHHTQTIYDLLPSRLRSRRFLCAGRLDKESEGLLILTTSGDLAHRLMHPSHRITKRYQVKVNKPFDPALVPALLAGREVEGEFLKAEKVIPATRGPDAPHRLEIHLHHGKKREIRRLLESFGYFVKRLRRVQIGGFLLRNLPPGAVRPLTSAELARILTPAPAAPRPREG